MAIAEAKKDERTNTFLALEANGAGGDSNSDSNSNSNRNSYNVSDDDRDIFNHSISSSSSSSNNSNSRDPGPDSIRQNTREERRQSGTKDNVIDIPAVSPYPKNVLQALLDKYNETRFLTRNVLKGITVYLSCYQMLYHVLSCLVLSCLVLSCLVLSCLVLS